MHIELLEIPALQQAVLRAGHVVIAVCGDAGDSRDIDAAAFRVLCARLAESGDFSRREVTEREWERACSVAAERCENEWDVLVRLIQPPSFSVSMFYGHPLEAGTRPSTQVFWSANEADACRAALVEAEALATETNDPFAVVVEDEDGHPVVVSPRAFDSRFTPEELADSLGRMPKVPGVAFGGGVANGMRYYDMAMDVGPEGELAAHYFQCLVRNGQLNTFADGDYFGNAGPNGCVEWVEGTGNAQIFRVRWWADLVPDAEAAERLFGFVAERVRADIALAARAGNAVEVSEPAERGSSPSL